jgi:hypothetical protein
VTALLSRRLVIGSGELAGLCERLGLLLPPGFEAQPAAVLTDGLLMAGAVHPSVAAGLTATCSPRVAVLLRTTTSGVAAAFGIRGDLGGSMVGAAESEVEISAWPAERLGEELARVARIMGVLRATVVAPPDVVGQVVCAPDDLGVAIAPLVAAAIA